MESNAKQINSSPQVLRTISELRLYVSEKRTSGLKIALIPTMGALHEGHLSLMRQAQQESQVTIATIFVNPKQFAPNEDLDAYPRTWDEDLDKLSAIGVDAVFYPSKAQMYPDGFATEVQIKGVSEPLEGEFRPHFFCGVATIVCKLLLQSLPDVAFFGEKDYQQLLVLKKMCADLDIPVEIKGVPTVRDENGLALSSRNAYLSKEEYESAVMINKTLYEMAKKIKAGAAFNETELWGHDSLRKAGFEKIDYLKICDSETLLAPDKNSSLRILVAAWMGKARLIDNIPVL